MKALIDPVRTRLQAMTQAERAAVGDRLGLPFSTVQKIAIGSTPDPQVSTWGPLALEFGVIKIRKPG